MNTLLRYPNWHFFNEQSMDRVWTETVFGTGTGTWHKSNFYYCTWYTTLKNSNTPIEDGES